MDKSKRALMKELNDALANQNLDDAVRSKTQDLLQMIKSVSGGMRFGVIRIATIAIKIDFATMVRD